MIEEIVPFSKYLSTTLMVAAKHLRKSACLLRSRKLHNSVESRIGYMNVGPKYGNFDFSSFEKSNFRFRGYIILSDNPLLQRLSFQRHMALLLFSDESCDA